MSSKKTRFLPSHVDGRIMVGKIPLKRFLLLLPFIISIVVFVFLNFTPIRLGVGGLLLGVSIILFSEINHKETGFDMLKDKAKYFISGDKFYERSCLDVPIIQRFIINKKVQDIKKRKHKTTD